VAEFVQGQLVRHRTGGPTAVVALVNRNVDGQLTLVHLRWWDATEGEFASATVYAWELEPFE